MTPMPQPMPADDDQESESRMTEELARSPEKTDADGWKTDSVSIRPAENGGFIVSTSKTKREASGGGQAMGPGSTYQSKDYAFGSLDEVQAYLQTEFRR